MGDWLNVEVDFEGDDARLVKQAASVIGEENYSNAVRMMAVTGAAIITSGVAAKAAIVLSMAAGG